MAGGPPHPVIGHIKNAKAIIPNADLCLAKVNGITSGELIVSEGAEAISYSTYWPKR